MHQNASLFVVVFLVLFDAFSFIQFEFSEFHFSMVSLVSGRQLARARAKIPNACNGIQTISHLTVHSNAPVLTFLLFSFDCVGNLDFDIHFDPFMFVLRLYFTQLHACLFISSSAHKNLVGKKVQNESYLPPRHSSDEFNAIRKCEWSNVNECESARQRNAVVAFIHRSMEFNSWQPRTTSTESIARCRNK